MNTKENSSLQSDDLLGKIAYNAYTKSVGGKSWNGDDLPTWDEMSLDIKKERLVTAWKEAGQAVFKYTKLIEIDKIIKSGNAGVMPNGNIVDRRIYPEAIKIPENKMHGIPNPK